jgi:hypothetical protein
MMGDKVDDEQSLSNLFADEADNDIVFAEQSMAGSLSHVVAESDPQQQKSSSTNNSLHASKSISTLFSKMAWNGSCTSFMGSGEDLLHFSSSTDDLEGSSDVLGITKKKRGSKRYVPTYKHTPMKLRTKPSPIKNRYDANVAKKSRMKQAPYLQLFVNDATDTDGDLDASISVAEMLSVDSILSSKEVKPSKFDDFVSHDSTLSESQRKPKRGLVRKESCLIESGRNKLQKTNHPSRSSLNRNKDKEDVAPKCPKRCESPTRIPKKSLRLQLRDDV